VLTKADAVRLKNQASKWSWYMCITAFISDVKWGKVPGK